MRANQIKLEESGLLTYEENGVKRCLGYLSIAEGHGVFDANLGKVEVAPEAAKRHNTVFDEMMVRKWPFLNEIPTEGNEREEAKEILSQLVRELSIFDLEAFRLLPTPCQSKGGKT